MAKTNDIIVNPIVGDTFHFLVTSDDSKGEVLKFKLSVKAGAQGPPEHRHPKQEEKFEIVSGTIGLKINGKEHILKDGQSMTVPRNAPHTFRNLGHNELVVMVEARPALRTEFFIETMASLAKQGKVKENAVPKSFLHFATILNEYYGEIFLSGPPVGPPVPLQKFLAIVVGGLGKLLGYKGFVPYDRN